MPEIQFTINPSTGQLETHITGVAGPSCDDIAKLVRELLGQPARETETAEYRLQPQVRLQVHPGQPR